MSSFPWSDAKRVWMGDKLVYPMMEETLKQQAANRDALQRALNPIPQPQRQRMDQWGPEGPPKGYQERKQLDRIEAKLDTLIAALADDDEKPQHTLDGELMPADRMEGDVL